MLQVAKSSDADADVIRARSEALPFGDGLFDRIFCVNALHHFTDPMAFLREARRVLGRGGGLMTIGLDPHRGVDSWWIYDHFPEALVEDQRRYVPTRRIRELMESAGFSACESLPGDALWRRYLPGEPHPSAPALCVALAHR